MSFMKKIFNKEGGGQPQQPQQPPQAPQAPPAPNLDSDIPPPPEFDSSGGPQDTQGGEQPQAQNQPPSFPPQGNAGDQQPQEEPAQDQQVPEPSQGEQPSSFTGYEGSQTPGQYASQETPSPSQSGMGGQGGMDQASGQYDFSEGLQYAGDVTQSAESALGSTEPESEIEAKRQAIRESHAPLFTRVEDYKDILGATDNIKDSLRATDDILKRINEIKLEEDREYEKWKNILLDVYKKINYVDRLCFEESN